MPLTHCSLCRVRQHKQEYVPQIITYFNGEVIAPHRCLDACRFLNDYLPRRDKGRYESVLPQIPEKDGHVSVESFNDGVGLYFHAELDSYNVMRLLPPERANSRRIFRKFGSHRFLHVKVDANVPDGEMIKKLGDKIVLCGRRYAFLWCKAQKSPQCYVLFAENGFGIDVEMSVDQVRDWCIPKAMNPALTVAKELKRMKLSFSKTTPTVVLPDNSIELIADIVDANGGPMTDGCGLMSRDALNEIWKHYSGASTLCPYSSFQGRIGGFKGMWVLDDSLEGMQIQCRTSQLKFSLPMKSLITTSECGPLQNDPLYDTVELNSWDEKPEKGFLVSLLFHCLLFISLVLH